MGASRNLTTAAGSGAGSAESMVRTAPFPRPYVQVRTARGSAAQAAGTDRRLIEWLDLTGDLLQRPQPEFPRALLGRQLLDTFDVRGVSWEWRDAPGQARFESWPPVDPGIFPPPAQHQELVERHPLVRWFTTSQDQRAQSTCRVPEAISPTRDRHRVEELLRPHDWEQQLSIPYALDGFSYEAFVLGRGGDEYGDDELELARHLQTLIRGLYLRLAPVATGARADASCAAAGRVGLTATELAVLVLLADGHTTYGISRRLGMAPRTASKHLEHIYRKLDVTHRVAAVNVARTAGLVVGINGQGSVVR
jgi:DNA-binding CsgD family transcriptional regulator